MTEKDRTDGPVSTFTEKPARTLGGFLAMTLDTFVAMLRRPPAVREFFRQALSIARAALLPMCMVAIPLAILLVFILEALVFGPAGFPTHTVLVAAATGATVVCAEGDSARIRREIDAMRFRGMDITHRFVVPRVLATAVAAVPLAFVAAGVTGVFFFSVFAPHNPFSQFVGNVTRLMSPSNIIVLVVEAAVLGLIGGLIACYKGISAADRPAAVGSAIGEIGRSA
ncbi:ABC transporter permease [Mycobacterium sp. NPDC050853]|uniref:MlaE family ABC transporter permease n=1 Tax=Mycobacterium sp. NPDC050853 TaxID=3155160 RepID=UPI0033E1CF57